MFQYCLGHNCYWNIWGRAFCNSGNYAKKALIARRGKLKTGWHGLSTKMLIIKKEVLIEGMVLNQIITVIKIKDLL